MGDHTYTCESNQATFSPRSFLRQTKRCHSLLSTLSSAFLGGRAYSALPCAGAPPPQRPPPTTCLADLVSIFVTGAHSKDLPQTTSPQVPEPISLRQYCRTFSSLLSTLSSPLCLPSHAQLTDSTVRPGLGPALRLAKKTLNNSSHRWHGFPARLFPPQNWDGPYTEKSGGRNLRPASCCSPQKQNGI